jgi:hypothetical protein
MSGQAIRRYLPAFIGGEDKTWQFYHADDSGPLDLTGYELSAEITWDGCTRYTLTEDDGLTVINRTPSAAPDFDDPDDANWHYSVTLSDSQSKCIPIGRAATLILVRTLDGTTTKRGPLGLERAA